MRIIVHVFRGLQYFEDGVKILLFGNFDDYLKKLAQRFGRGFLQFLDIVDVPPDPVFRFAEPPQIAFLAAQPCVEVVDDSLADPSYHDELRKHDVQVHLERGPGHRIHPVEVKDGSESIILFIHAYLNRAFILIVFQNKIISIGEITRSSTTIGLK